MQVFMLAQEGTLHTELFLQHLFILKIKGVSLFLGRVSCMSVHLVHSTIGKGIFGWFLLQISAIAL